MGVLSWLIEEGAADGVDLSGLPVAMAVRYDDDEAGSPWTWILYLGEQATSEQRAALERIFTGRSGGDAEAHFPWVWKRSELVAVRPVAIDVDHARRRQWLRIRDYVRVSIRDRYEGAEAVSCVIPGHELGGEELVTDELAVADEGLAFSYSGVCGFAHHVRLRRPVSGPPAAPTRSAAGHGHMRRSSAVSSAGRLDATMWFDAISCACQALDVRACAAAASKTGAAGASGASAEARMYVRSNGYSSSGRSRRTGSLKHARGMADAACGHERRLAGVVVAARNRRDEPVVADGHRAGAGGPASDSSESPSAGTKASR